MQIAFAIIAALTLVSAVAAMSFRNLVHLRLERGGGVCGTGGVIPATGRAVRGVGAGAHLYRGGGHPDRVCHFTDTQQRIDATTQCSRALWVAERTCRGGGGAGVLVRAILSSPVAVREPSSKPEPTVKQIGTQLMTRYVLPLEAIGLLLTAAAIGAAIIALHEPERKNAGVAGVATEPPGAESKV